MPQQRDEVSELEQMALDDDDVHLIVTHVLKREGVPTIRRLFDKNPDLVFELHEEMAVMVRETGHVGDFEAELERPVIRRADLEDA